MWTIAHILSGVLLGIGLFWLDWSFLLASIAALVALVGWEVFESIIGIGENVENVVVDILTGIAGFVAIWYLQAQQGYEITLVGALAIGVPAFAFALWGFTDYLKNGYR